MGVDACSLEQGCESIEGLRETEVGFVGYITDFDSIKTLAASLSREDLGYECCVDTVEQKIDLGRGILDSMAEVLHYRADMKVQQPIHVVLRGLLHI